MRKYRDWSVKQLVQAWYVPTLIYAVSMAFALIYGVYLQQQGEITIGQLVAYSVLYQQFGFPVHISTFSFSMVQIGMAGARRVLGLINEKTELDQNTGGFVGELEGDIVFETSPSAMKTNPFCRMSASTRGQARRSRSLARPAQQSTLSKLVNHFRCRFRSHPIDGRDGGSGTSIRCGPRSR